MSEPGNQLRPYTLKAGEGWIYRFFGVEFNIKAGEIQQGHGAAFLEYTTTKGEEPPDHTHDTENEMFYVLEGSITFRCGEKTFDLEKGGFIFLPHGLQHGYTIRGEDPVHLIIVTSPAREGISEGWGGFVTDIESKQGELVAKPSSVD